MRQWNSQKNEVRFNKHNILIYRKEGGIYQFFPEDKALDPNTGLYDAMFHRSESLLDINAYKEEVSNVDCEQLYFDICQGELPCPSFTDEIRHCDEDEDKYRMSRRSHVVVVGGSFIKDEYVRRNELKSSIGIERINSLYVDSHDGVTLFMESYFMKIGDFQRHFPQKLSVQQMDNIIFHFMEFEEQFEDCLNTLEDPLPSMNDKDDPFYFTLPKRGAMLNFLMIEKNAEFKKLDDLKIDGIEFLF